MLCSNPAFGFTNLFPRRPPDQNQLSSFAASGYMQLETDQRSPGEILQGSLEIVRDFFSHQTFSKLTRIELEQG